MRALLIAVVVLGAASSTFAQDPIAADPAHFQRQATSTSGVPVVKLTLPPGERTLEPGYFVYLTNALLDVHRQDGVALRGSRIERGRVEASATRRPPMQLENPTAQTIEILLIPAADARP